MEKEIILPKPRYKGEVSIEETLNRRRSVREYRAGGLRFEEVSQLLWAAAGKNLYRRTFPSAGATYPVEVYLVSGEVEALKPGVYHYIYSTHSLKKIKDQDVRRPLCKASLEQSMIEESAVSFIIAADYQRTTNYYGQRGFRYVYMEVGHIGQNLSLQAIALNIGTVMIGAFDDKRVKEILEIEEDPLYIIPAGRI